ncbi:MAG: hypothetical protein AAB596_01180 [Patescibacteria group bacterium]
MKMMTEEDMNEIAYKLLKYEIKKKSSRHFDFNKKTINVISKKTGIPVEELVAFKKTIEKEAAEEVLSSK